MKIICKVQDHLVVAHRAENNGEFIFVLCRAGVEKALNKKLVTGKRFQMQIIAKLNKYLE